MVVKRGRTGHQSKQRYDSESNETGKKRKKKKKKKEKEKKEEKEKRKGADVFITCFQKHMLSKFSRSENDDRSI